MNKSVITGVIVLVVALAGGGALLIMSKDSDTDKSSTKTSSSAPTESESMKMSESEKTNDEASTSNAVSIEDFAFNSNNITVKKGTTVTWTNKDSVAHTVTKDGDTGPDSELIAQGKTYSFTFDEVGTFKYHCTPHPQMTGTVTVTE